MSEKSVLVVFDDKLPRKIKNWWRQFDSIIAPAKLKLEILKRVPDFINLDDLVEPGSVQEAYKLVNKLSRLTFPDGRRVSKLLNYKGYELWWVHYDNLYYNFCLPYTQYQNLLNYLKNFGRVTLYKPPAADIFRYFLESHNCRCLILDESRKKFPPAAILLQVIASLIFLPWLAVKRPKLMIWTSDQFDPPRDYDFRLRFIYEEIRKNKIPFVEFIRSQESLSAIIRHIWYRKRPVIYSGSIVHLLYRLARFGKKNDKVVEHLVAKVEPENRFMFLIATHFLRSANGTIWSARIMRAIIKAIGVKAAIISAAISRNFHEVLGCKLAGVGTVGIQHGAQIQTYCPYDFMPEFDGKNNLSVDKYGLWSDWWKAYFIKNSRAYKPEQLYVSGLMRPLESRPSNNNLLSSGKTGPIKVLFVAEQLAAPSEAAPYLSVLIDMPGIILYLKFRSYRDGFEMWLENNYPEILNKVKVLRGSIHDAVSQCDVVVGSHSTGVLEALLQLKPPVFFKTQKWDDFFDMRSVDTEGRFFADTPQKLMDCIRRSGGIPKEVLGQLREKFFGDPYKNGSKWVVQQAKNLI